jgi:hypothetical protein
MLVLSVMLALVTQLKHVGFVAACYVAGIGLGGTLGKPKLVQASVTALLVFMITYLACWVSLGDRREMEYGSLLIAQAEMTRFSEALSNHTATGGTLPDRLQDVPEISAQASRVDPAGRPLDPWGHPYHYRTAGDGFELASLGRDGRTGGAGLDADVTLDDGVSKTQSRLPISQFLFETAGSRSVFGVALVASILSGSLWLGSAKRESLPPKGVVVGIAVTTLFAVLVASFLAAFHVAASQSGH